MCASQSPSVKKQLVTATFKNHDHRHHHTYLTHLNDDSQTNSHVTVILCFLPVARVFPASISPLALLVEIFEPDGFLLCPVKGPHRPSFGPGKGVTTHCSCERLAIKLPSGRRVQSTLAAAMHACCDPFPSSSVKQLLDPFHACPVAPHPTITWPDA